jgi:enoyl reductase-like protein
MADRYIELIYNYQSILQRDLTIDEIQFIKGIVAKEFNQKMNESVNQTMDTAVHDTPVLCM